MGENEKFLRAILHELNKDKALAERDKTIAERDRQILLMQIEDRLRTNDQRALPPGFIPQNAPDLQAHIDALKQEVENLKTQFAELKER